MNLVLLFMFIFTFQSINYEKVLGKPNTFFILFSIKNQFNSIIIDI